MTSAMEESGLAERSWNGVAILGAGLRPGADARSNLPGNPDDRQARYVEAKKQ